MKDTSNPLAGARADQGAGVVEVFAWAPHSQLIPTALVFYIDSRC